jgi:hypothetical protein
MNIIEKHKLYKLNPTDKTYILITEIESECKKKDLNLSRWKSNDVWSGYGTTITWGIHKGERKRNSKESNLLFYKKLGHPEGKTENCEAYFKLYELLNLLKENNNVL